jgi:hypothetical protein
MEKIRRIVMKYMLDHDISYTACDYRSFVGNLIDSGPKVVFLRRHEAVTPLTIRAYITALRRQDKVLFVVHDGGTEPRWRVSDVVAAMGMESYDIDATEDDVKMVSENFLKKPILIEVTDVNE